MRTIANNIKGITVEINGETGPLDKALKGVNSTSRDLQKELREVEKGLKLDPGNTVLLAQKQELLAKSITNTKEKLDALKTAEEQAQAKFAEGEISEQQYRALQREVINTEQSLERLETQAVQSNAVLSSDQATGNLKKMAVAAGAAAVAVGASFVGMGVAAMNNADELQRQADVTGFSAERLQELQYAGNNLGVELDVLTGAQAKLIKSMDAARGGTGAQSDGFKELGISVLDGNGHLRDAKDVMGEAFTALGKVGNETERDALSMKIFGKSAMEMNPMIKAGGEELNRLTKEAKNNGSVMSNEAVAGLDTFGDTMDNIKNSILGSVGESLAKLMPTLQAILEKMMQLPQWIQKNSTMLEIVGVAIATVTALVIAFNIQQALLASGLTLWGAIAGVGTTITTGLGVAFAFLTSPIALIIIAIGLLVAGFLYLWNNCEGFRAFWIGLWDGIKTTTKVVIDALVGFFTITIPSAFNAVIDFVKNNWQGILLFIVNPFAGAFKLLYDNCSGFRNFINNLWISIKTTIENVFNGIKNFFIMVWNGIVTGVMAILNPFILGITNIFNSLKAGVAIIFEGVKLYFTGVWNAIKLIFLGPILLICDLVTGNFRKLKTDAEKIFNGLKVAFGQIWDGIKLVFTGVVTAISGFLKMEWNLIVNIAITIWNGLKTFMSSLWEGIKSTASYAWNALKSTVVSICNSIVSGAKSVWDGLISFFTGLPARLLSIGSNMFTSMKSGVTSTISGVTNAITSGFNNAIAFITGLPGKARGWGIDFIQGLIGGLKSMIGSVGSAVKGVADKITSFLHFSVPDEGPLTDYESWMPDFMGGLAKGIANSKSLVTDAVKGLSTDMSVGMNLTPGMLGIGSFKNANNDTVPSTPTYGVNTGSSRTESISKQPVILQVVTPDKHILASWLVDEITDKQQFNLDRLKLF